MRQRRNRIRNLAQIGMLSAVAVVLMLFEIPLPFAPSFYEIDFSEVPVLIGCFAMGPMAGITIEFVKILLNLFLNGTITAGVGELGNFLIGCSLCIPASVIYRKVHSRRGALFGMIVGTLCMTGIGCIVNAYLLLPTYVKAMGLPMESIVGMGTAVNPKIQDLQTLVLYAVAPFNLLKGILVSIIVLLIYKKIRPLLKVGVTE